MSTERKKPTADEVFSGELLDRSADWVVACIDPHIAWPKSVVKMSYRGQTIFILPQCDDYYPSIAVQLGRGIETFEQAQVLILNLLSVLCWIGNRGALIDYWMGGNLPRPMAGFSRSGIRIVLTDYFEHHYLPDITDEKARWALAFYREGLAMRPRPYAFLSLYKIVNMLHAKGRDQKAWINTNVDAAARHDSKKRLTHLRLVNNDIGAYLFESCRCAIAHAGQGPTVDPENPSDLRRLEEDFPLIRDLAAFAIEREFGIKSIGTIFREHLYELEGFRRILGDALVTKLKQRTNVRPDELPPFPPLHIGLHGQDDYPPLTELAARVTEIEQGVVNVECVGGNGHIQLMIGLDFPNERLLSSFFDGLITLDDGSERAARDAISVMAFKRRYLLNGELSVKRADTGERLGRCDPFIPTNVDMGRSIKGLDAVIDHLTKLAERRRQAAS